MDDQKLHDIIQEIFYANNENYGSPLINEDLKKWRIFYSCNIVPRIMQEKRLKARPNRKFKIITYTQHDYSIVENLLDRNFSDAEANKF